MHKGRSAISALAMLVAGFGALESHAQEMTREQIQGQLDLLKSGQPKTRSLNVNNSVDLNRPLYPSPPQTVDIQFHNILFALDSADIEARSDATLTEIVAVLADSGNQNLRFEIIGHTDASGSDSYNLALSNRRAASVKAYLIAHGVPAAHLRAEGRGETELLKGENPFSGVNRRVVLRARLARSEP